MIRILYVDDSPFDRGLVLDALEKEHGGFAVIQAASRSEFESALAKGNFDLVLSDFNILGFEGLQVLELVHARDINIPVIIVTGTGSEEIAVEAMKQGAADYVIKTPKHIQRLPLTIHAALEKKRLKEQHWAAQERYRSIYENAVEGIYQSTQNGQFLSVNPAMARIYGYDSPQEMLEKITDIESQIYVKRRERSEFIRLLTENGKVENFEAQNYRKDGSIIWVRSDARLVNIEGLEPYFEGFLSDITAHKQAEQAMQDIELRLESIVNSAMDAILIIDEEQNIAIFNPAAEHMFRCQSSDVIGRSLAQFMPPESRARHATFVRKFGESGMTRRWMGRSTLPLNCLRANGEVFPGEISISQFEVSGQRFYTAIVRDVTEREQAEDAFRQVEQKYRNIFENAVEGIHQTTQEGKYISANPAAARILGYESPEELMSRVNDLNTQFYVELGRRQEFVTLMELQDAVSNFESEVYRKDGSRVWVSENAHTVRDEHGNLLYYEGTTEDITERKRTQVALRESEARYRDIFDGVQEAIFVETLDGRVLAVNERACEMYGYSREELLTKTVADLVPKNHPILWVGGPGRILITTPMESLNLRASGEAFPIEISGRYQTINGEKVVLVVVHDITERKRADDELRASEARLRAVLETSPISITLNSLEDGAVIYGNSALADLLGVPLSNIVGQRAANYYADPADRSKALAELEKRGSLRDYEVHLRRPDGKTMWVSLSTAKTSFDGRPCLLSCFYDITERKRMEEKLERQNQRLKVLREIDTAILAADSVESIVGAALSHIRELIDCQWASLALIDWETNEGLIFNVKTISDAFMPKGTRVSMALFQDMNQTLSKKQLVLINDLTALPSLPPLFQTGIKEGLRSVCVLPLFSQGNLIGAFSMSSEVPGFFDEEKINFGREVANQVAIAIENASLFEAERRRRRETAALAEVSRDISSTLQLEIVLERITSYAKDLLDAETSAVYLVKPATRTLQAASAIGPDAEEIRHDPLRLGEGILGNIALQKRGEIINDTDKDPRAITIRGTADTSIEHLIGVPVLAEDRLTGLIAVWRVGKGREFKRTDLEFLNSLAQQVAIAIENARLFESTRQRLAYLEVLQTIASPLRSASNLDEAIPIILDQLISLMDVGGALLDILDPPSGEIVTRLARGLWAPVTGMRTPANAGVSSRVISTGQPYITTDLIADGLIVRPDLVGGLNAAACVPVIAQHRAIGALWVGRKTSIIEEEVTLLTALGEMVGNTIHRMSLHEQTKRLLEDLHAANLELIQAYDSTLEGWAKALELRDRETEGHTRRVTEVTLRLAKYMGIPDDEMVNIHRGALLHDIGKVGVPDHILRKSGPLTDPEWAEMRQHPQYAYNMLSSITYLRGAIDIPYCHHEHWDGSGYPRGLRGSEIPRAARIFAVVDVWDALAHDRPYRTAWSREKIIEHMQEQSGQLFDPAIVEIFLKMITTHL